MAQPTLTLSGNYRRPCYKRFVWWSRTLTIFWLWGALLFAVTGSPWMAAWYLALACVNHRLHWCHWKGWRPRPEHEAAI